MKRYKILVVDDDPQNLHLMRVVLEGEFSLVYATNGKKAVQAAEKHTPDLILMDVMMPEMDGYEACSKIKAHPGPLYDSGDFCYGNGRCPGRGGRL